MRFNKVTSYRRYFYLLYLYCFVCQFRQHVHGMSSDVRRVNADGLANDVTVVVTAMIAATNITAVRLHLIYIILLQVPNVGK